MKVPARVFGVFVSLALGCHAPERHPDATLGLRVHQAEAAVFVDDAIVPVAPGGSRVKLLSGVHRIEVRAPGCFTAYREISVPAGETREIDLPLRPDPDAEVDPACQPLSAPAKPSASPGGPGR